jgi:hypothetical protein
MRINWLSNREDFKSLNDGQSDHHRGEWTANLYSFGGRTATGDQSYRQLLFPSRSDRVDTRQID